MNLAIAAATNMEAWQVDYVAAYLNSKPQATVFIELPDGAKQEGRSDAWTGHYTEQWMVQTTGGGPWTKK